MRFLEDCVCPNTFHLWYLSPKQLSQKSEIFPQASTYNKSKKFSLAKHYQYCFCCQAAPSSIICDHNEFVNQVIYIATTIFSNITPMEIQRIKVFWILCSLPYGSNLTDMLATSLYSWSPSDKFCLCMKMRITMALTWPVQCCCSYCEAKNGLK